MSNFDFYCEGGICYASINKHKINFMFDDDMIDVINSRCWYPSVEGTVTYLIDRNGNKLHSLIIKCPTGYEVDHINLNALDNRRCNLRICTHQQNQINQPLQKNNTSGVTGVSWYPARNKYRARLKISQTEIHLGYYDSFIEAVQARNAGMEYMFGEYGRYNNVPGIPEWIRIKVFNKCKRFSELSVSKAFVVLKEVG